MQQKRILTLTILLFLYFGGRGGLLFATDSSTHPYSDSVLYQAYLHNNIKIWKDYIEVSDWQHLNLTERLRLLHYEYGYVATLIDATEGKTNLQAATYLARYERHLTCLQDSLSPSQYAAYLSAANAYTFMLDKRKLISAGLQSFQLAKNAVRLDSNEPMALILKGNIYFYAPRALGGNKQQALEMYLKAKQQLEKQRLTAFNWTYTALLLCIAQCYEKTGQLDKAIEETQRILKNNPEFIYVRDTYLPSLLRAKSNKK